MACYLLMAGNKVRGGERREEAGRSGKKRRKGGGRQGEDGRYEKGETKGGYKKVKKEGMKETRRVFNE